jgi:ABC-type sulfate transport system permease component
MRIVRLLLVAAVPLGVLGVFFVLPVVAMVSLGFRPDGTFDPVGVLEVLGRPRVHRVLWFTLWSATVGTLVSLALGLPAAHVLYRRRLLGGKVLRAALLAPFVLPTVVVGVAFRQLIGESGPLGFLGFDGAAVAIIAGLVFFNASVVIRVVGGAWESLDPRPAEAAAALGATPAQVLRTVTLPALRPAVVSAATVVFLFCATSFGVVLTLGGLRYSSIETEIYLLTTQLLDLQAAAALSVLQLVVVTGLLLGAARARRTADPSVARVVARPRRLSRGDSPALVATTLLALLVAGPIVALVVGSLRTDGVWSLANYRALGSTGERQALTVPVTEALTTSLRTAVDATWMSLLLGLTVAVIATRRSRSTAERRVRTPDRRRLHAAPRRLGRDPGLRVPDHPRRAAARPARLAPARADRPGAGGPAAGGPHPRPGARRRRPPAPRGRRDPRRVALAGVDDGRPAGRRPPAARRRRLRVRGLAGGVRGDLVPGARRAPDAARGDLRADQPPWPDELRHGPGGVGRARRDDRRRDAAGGAAARAGRDLLMLSLRDVAVSYDGAPAVVDVDLELPDGQVLAVLGPSGCGKSTLLRAVAGLEPLAAGTVSWDGADLAGVPTHKRGFALLFQDGQLFGHLTVARNVGYALRLRRAPDTESRVAELLELVGLAGYGDRLPATLSAASASGSRWPGRWPPIRACCCWTSRSRPSTPVCGSGSRPTCATSCGRPAPPP